MSFIQVTKRERGGKRKEKEKERKGFIIVFTMISLYAFLGEGGRGGYKRGKGR